MQCTWGPGSQLGQVVTGTVAPGWGQRPAQPPAQSAPSACPQAFTSGLRRYLQYYRACVLSTPPTLSLIAIAFLFRKLGRQLR